MNTPLLWAALQIATAPSMSATPWPTPTLHTIPSVGQLVLADSPNPDLTSVRVFVPLSPELRGSDVTRILVELAGQRARSLADRAGIQFSASLAPDGIVYAATGSNLDVDHVFAVVSSAIGSPEDNRFAYAQASERLRQERELAAETGGGWITSTLSSRLCVGYQPRRVDLRATGMDAARQLGQETHTAWTLSHAAPAPVLTVVTSLPQAVVFGGLDLIRSSLPGDLGDVALGAVEPLPTPRAPSLLRVWTGTAQLLPDNAHAVALVVGELLQEAVSSTSGESELYSEIRSTPCGMALFTWGSAFPRASRALRARVEDLPSRLGESFDSATVARAANRVRFRVLVNSDTPAGRAAAVASSHEARRPVSELIDELETMGLDDVLGALGVLEESSMVRAEVGR